MRWMHMHHTSLRAGFLLHMKHACMHACGMGCSLVRLFLIGSVSLWTPPFHETSVAAPLARVPAPACLPSRECKLALPLVKGGINVRMHARACHMRSCTTSDSASACSWDGSCRRRAACLT